VQWRALLAAHPAGAAMDPRRGGGATLEVRPQDQPVFEALRLWRRGEAQAQALPPYIIFPDRTLADIALMRPRDMGELANCNGVGQGKLERYGAAVLRIVRESEVAG
jgi:ATP-dependent DNA helicase RecQ